MGLKLVQLRDVWERLSVRKIQAEVLEQVGRMQVGKQSRAINRS